MGASRYLDSKVIQIESSINEKEVPSNMQIPLNFLTCLSNDHSNSLLEQFTISFYFDPL